MVRRRERPVNVVLCAIQTMPIKGFKTWCPNCFKALSTEVRSGIVNILADQKEHTVNQIVSHFKLRQPTISYHLSTLERVGLLKSRTDGRHVYYRLNNKCPYDSEKCILR